jgi:hypothetical protein
MAKRKKVLTPEQEALLNQFQNNNNDNNDNKLDENNNVKANSSGFKPMINRSGSRGK